MTRQRDSNGYLVAAAPRTDAAEIARIIQLPRELREQELTKLNAANKQRVEAYAVRRVEAILKE